MNQGAEGGKVDPGSVQRQQQSCSPIPAYHTSLQPKPVHLADKKPS